MTFERCKLNHEQRRMNAHITALYCDLMKLRREDPVFSAQRSDWIQGAVLGPEAFLLRFFGRPNSDRLLVVNLGRTLKLRPGPEPLLAASAAAAWRLLWTSEDPRYEGKSRGNFGDAPRISEAHEIRGASPKFPDFPSTIPGHCALVMYEGSGD